MSPVTYVMEKVLYCWKSSRVTRTLKEELRNLYIDKCIAKGDVAFEKNKESDDGKEI